MTDDAPIEFTCGMCGKPLKVRARGAGRTIACPGCGQSVTVPVPEVAAVGDDFNPFAGFADAMGVAMEPADNPLPEPINSRPFAPITRPAPAESIVAAALPPHRPRAADEIHLPPSRSYPVLTLIAAVCRILAGIIAVLAVGAMLITVIVAVKTGGGMADPKSGLALAFTILPIGFGSLIAALGLLVNAELITLAIHIQANTLATAHASRRAG
jgi:DNA-directed RNA polymerase subunit RPC12/RpoP